MVPFPHYRLNVKLIAVTIVILTQFQRFCPFNSCCVSISKIMKKFNKKFDGALKLPPIGEIKEDGVKTIIDVDPQYYSVVEGRPIRPNISIIKYKQNIREIALKRTLHGFLVDEILHINREMVTERKVYETAHKHFDEYRSSFDNFLADNNDKTIIVMRKSDNLERELANRKDEHRQANYELASIKSKVQYIYETLQILLSFKFFLYKASPVLWQRANVLSLEPSEVIILESDIFRAINVVALQVYLSKLPPPVLYFKAPDQLPKVFSFLEKQNLNYLLFTEQLNAEKIKFLKSLGSFKNLIKLEFSYIQKQIKVIEDSIHWNELREEELKEIFYKVLDEKLQYIVSSEAALKIFNYVEFTYEKLIAPNDANLSSYDMALYLEREFSNLMLDLSAFDEDTIKRIEKELYENESNLTRQAYEANKLLKDVNKLNKRLQSSYEPAKLK